MCAYPIEVFHLGPADFADHSHVMKALNAAQREFLYVAPSEHNANWASQFVRGHYELDALFGRFERFRDESKGFHPYIIYVLHGTLSDGTSPSINMNYMRGRGIVVCTLKKWLSEATEPPSAFLSYVFLHSAAIFAYPSKIMHGETRNCLFDEVVSDELRRSMSSLIICDYCRDELIDNIADSEVNLALLKMLDATLAFNTTPRERDLSIGPKTPRLSDFWLEASPDFVAIYLEASEAEQRNLLRIAGSGFRKALEFLIKDYLN